MPRRPTARSRARAKSTAAPAQAGAMPRAEPARRRGRAIWPWAIGGATVAVALVLTLIWVLVVKSPSRLITRAEAAAQAGDWTAALEYWRSVNATESARIGTHLGEARACLALNRAAQAERSLHRALAADPTDLEPWKLLLEILQVEDRLLEAQRLGLEAYDRVHPEARRDLLKELTQGLLAELPDELVRTTLRRWVEADGDGDDVDAQVALWQRIAAQPRADDPDRYSLLQSMETLLAGHPDHIGAREALVAALADAGEPQRGRALLDEWPERARDARYWRLRGRWELEYDHRPDRAAAAFQTTVAELPQDWRSWYRLARALRILGRDREGRQAAETVSRIREVLDPLTLGPQLDAAFDHLDDPAALRNLAAICNRAGLTRLADAWRTEAQIVTRAPGSVAP